MRKKITLITYLFFAFHLFGQQSNIDSLKVLLSQAELDTVKIDLNVKLSNSFNYQEKDSSLYYFNNALKLADSIAYKKTLADKLYDLGYDYELNNDFEKAIRSYEKAIFIYEELGDLDLLAELYNYVGYAYIQIYAEDKGIEFYIKSLKLFERLNDEQGIALNYIDIGNLYYDQKKFDDAKKFFQDALTIYEKQSDNEGIATSYTNLGNVFADDGDCQLGIDYYKQSIILEEEINDEYGIAINYNNIGDCYIQLKLYDEALSYFLESFNIATKINDDELIALIYLNIADVYLQQNKYYQAIAYANKSLEISKEIGKLDFQLENFLFLAQSFEAFKNDSKALFYYKEHYRVKDSIFDSDKANIVQLFNALNELENTHYTISELSNKNQLAELKFENGRKISYFLIVAIILFAMLIILLIHQRNSKKKAYNLLEFRNYQINKMNNEIQKQRDHLRELNKTKDKFFSIIAHDLKNPFNSIKGFTELLIDNNQEYDEEKQLKFLRIIKDSTTKASALLNNLLVWANSQSGNLDYNPKKTELVKDVLDVVSLLEIQAIKKEIDIYNNVDHNLLVKADENMLNTILRNLISNAIKFTKQHGEIKIQSVLNKNMVEITVKDNGVGIPKEDIDSLFSIDVKNTHVGTANEQGSGLGLVLCKDFVEKHSGEIWVNSSENEGTEFTFSIPLWNEDTDFFKV